MVIVKFPIIHSENARANYFARAKSEFARAKSEFARAKSEFARAKK